MQEQQETVLRKAAEKVVEIVAGAFVDGGGDKTAQRRIKEELRQVWQAGAERTHTVC